MQSETSLKSKDNECYTDKLKLMSIFFLCRETQPENAAGHCGHRIRYVLLVECKHFYILVKVLPVTEH